MFIGREAELKTLEKQFAAPSRAAVLVYGKRRVGKSTLISQAAKSFHGTVIEHLCVQSTFRGNLELLCRSVGKSLGLPTLRFEYLSDLFDFLKARGEPVLLVIDEYQYMKESLKGSEVDSYFQAVIDSLPEHVKLVLCGSYVTVMRELLEEDNPLFGRFTSILHVQEFDYYNAARFFPDKRPYEKTAYYGLFGGSPFVLASLDYALPPEENMIRLLLPETGILRTHIESVMLKEVQRAFDMRILEALGNGRKRYSEIQSVVGAQSSGLLDKQLKNLMNMETIRKVSPVNRRNDKKKQFYEISDNLMRLYFAYVFGNAAQQASLGERAFFDSEVASSIAQFVDRRFEDIAQQYFMRQARAGHLPGVHDLGSFWYDDPATRTNGEFDCVLDRGSCLDFYECKRFDRPMTDAECESEAAQVRAIPSAIIGAIGFVCTGGFAFETGDYRLVTGNDLYSAGLGALPR
jgi:AAA+ ATPase superfamily predicted ATPase